MEQVKQLNIANIQLNLEGFITCFDENFSQLLDITETNVIGVHLNTILDDNIFEKITPFKTKITGLLFKNHKSKSNINTLQVIYLNVTKNTNTYNIKFVNWLNWLNKLYNSSENAYNLITKMNNKDLLDFNKLSDIYAFNALYPLLMHIPLNHINNISGTAFYDILRNFINRKNNDVINKDYARNVYSRLKTSIREETGISNMLVSDILKNEQLLNLTSPQNLCIANTQLTKNQLFLEYNDEILDLLLNKDFT